MPQAPSFDVVPCRTDSCHATPAAAIRCKPPQRQPSDNLRLPPKLRKPPRGLSNTHSPCHAAEMPTLLLPPKQWPRNATSQKGSLETTPLRRSRRQCAAVAHPELDRVFTQSPVQTRGSFKITPPIGKTTPRGAAVICASRNAGKDFRPEHQPLATCSRLGTPGP